MVEYPYKNSVSKYIDKVIVAQICQNLDCELHDWRRTEELCDQCHCRIIVEIQFLITDNDGEEFESDYDSVCPRCGYLCT